MAARGRGGQEGRGSVYGRKLVATLGDANMVYSEDSGVEYCDNYFKIFKNIKYF